MNGEITAEKGSVLFKKVTKTYSDGTRAVDRLDLEIRRGELVSLIGPSGCGKTTTLKMINRLEEPTEGTITVDGMDILSTDPVKLRRRIGYVVQEIALFPHLTVAENIGVVPNLLGWPAKKTRARVNELLSMAGLSPEKYRFRLPDQLSGGQKQRIGVLRALASDPQVILMDEPFGALDPISRETLQNELVSLQKDLKKTIVFVTHDMGEALRISDRIVILRKGRVEQEGTPEEIQNSPKNDFVRSFIGEDRLSRMSPDDPVESIIEDPWGKAAPWESAAEVLERMEENDREFIQVIDPKSGQWLGMALLGRVRRAASAGETVLKGVNRDRKLYAGEATLRDAAEMLSDRDISIPVLDGDGHFIGVITSTALARLAVERLRSGTKEAQTA
ncbi:MAG: betaine/proline/choline family ABC transporter ATP-binding protein [Synergistaceae bacterium]|uniref:betaine/proline/choline family ABC transporter ATP-binding protein n=1 Tax=Aminivibrio sp. TaxID=1872489 RepID=UPI002A23350B|nr:betaine/proline/choline family ABC transporter ATP-binding protein [Synergistaceae bacterium]MDD3390981.1 betaine/proline/choline family ABC transporter ATP-binding protein [Synergistaceae bacterium]MDD3689295.1 betaine/proline/choline family ABC transporter ATP-binding protein [Synergistaceae bacterium]MDD4021368.1 betaine/proline/choline family ABC transporter ATP-binding protein [Synergistaceae bacterium]MDD4612784.1 betaine/proline/choline family ABC transporter ATP-binding protein [Syne